MTREEAIKSMEYSKAQAEITLSKGVTQYWKQEINWTIEAIDMAIEALKREPGEDGTLEVKVEDATKIGRVLITDDKHRGGLYYHDEDEPQGDLISRAEAIEAIELVDWYHQNSNKDMVSGANSDEHQAWYKADDVYKALEAVPSADRPRPIDPTYVFDPESGVVPLSACEPKGPKTIIYADRPKGHWIVIDEYSACSVCDAKIDWYDLPYCPFCGAKMDVRSRR